MSVVDSWIFMVTVFAVLWAFWKLMNLTADAFSQWWNDEHEDEQ